MRRTWGLGWCVLFAACSAAMGQEAGMPPVEDRAEPFPLLRAVRASMSGCGTDTNPYSPRAALGGGVWTGGQVFYAFDPAITAGERQNMLDAWAQISAACNVVFVPRVAQANYITVTRNPSNANVSFSSSIGMAGGQQFLQIGANHWVLSGLLIHETLHALGFFHEQQRSDRNTYMTVNTASINPAFVGNYNIAGATIVGNYDFDSIMHYQLDAFVNSGVAMVLQWPYAREWQWRIGRYLIPGAGLSAMDRVGLVSRYGGNAPPRAFLLNTPTFGQRVGTAWNRTVNWFASTGATSYRVVMDDDPYFRTPFFDRTQTTTQYIHATQPLADTLYYIRATATNAMGTTATAPIGTYMIYTGDTWPSTLYVDASAPAGGNGRSWATALNDLRIAVDLAAAAFGATPEVRVAAGTYRADAGSGDREATFWIPRGCAIRGGYAGRNAPNPDARDIAANATILTGDLAGNDGANFANIGENAMHVVSGDGSSLASRLEGFTIRGGNANGVSFYDTWGAGLRMAAGSATIADCVFEGHSAGLAAAVLADDGGPKFVRCTFRDTRSLINDVSAFFSYGGSAFVTNGVFTGNTGGFGGGAYSIGGTPTYVNCLFAGNSVTAGGGAIGFQSNGGTANATIANCTFAGNDATVHGGAFAMYSGTVSMRNCIAWENTSPVGAQLATGFYGYTGGTLAVSESLAQGGQAAVYVGAGNTLTWGAGNVDADPRFVDAGAGDYGLQFPSPCIDAGNTATLPQDRADLDGDLNTAEATPMDLAGAMRVAFASVDMGAYEWQGPRCVADVDDGSGTGMPDGGVTIDDLLYYLFLFEQGLIAADVDDGSGTGMPDGGVTIDDLLYYLFRFEMGC